MQLIDEENIAEQKEELLKKIGMLYDRYVGVHSGRTPAMTLIKFISGCACERQIRHGLENSDFINRNVRFDPYYRQKSEFATLKILE